MVALPRGPRSLGRELDLIRSSRSLWRGFLGDPFGGCPGVGVEGSQEPVRRSAVLQAVRVAVERRERLGLGYVLEAGPAELADGL